jgi:hypothetical protein
MSGHQQRAGPCRAHAVCQHQTGHCRQPDGIAVLPEPEWALEIQLGDTSGAAAGGFLQTGLRRATLERNSGPLQLAVARLWHVVLPEQWLHISEGLASCVDGAAYVERDPVGSYRHEFEVPATWSHKTIPSKLDQPSAIGPMMRGVENFNDQQIHFQRGESRRFDFVTDDSAKV